jgi:N-acetylneuraminic acid mutarotase
MLKIGTLLAGVVLLAGCSRSPAEPTPRVLTVFEVRAGSGQTGPVMAELPSALTVRTLDAAGAPLEGMTVTFAVSAGAGSVSADSVITGKDGQAQTSWTLGPVAGQGHEVRARATDPGTGRFLEATFSATATPGPVTTLIKVSGDGQGVSGGGPLPAPLVVRVHDAYGNAVAGATVTWKASAGTLVPEGLSGADGFASALWTLGVEGAHTATATVGQALVNFDAEVWRAGWTYLPNMLVPVRGASAVALDGRVHVLGGFTSGYQRTIAHQIFDPATGTWAYGPTVPAQLDHAAAVVTSTGIHVLGGVTATGSVSNQHYLYSPTTRRWSVLPPLPEARKAAVAWAITDRGAERIYVFGGLNEPEPGVSVIQDEVLVYDVAASTWTTAGAMPNPRFTPAVTHIGGEILILGGTATDWETTRSGSSAVSAFNPSTATWRDLPSLPQPRDSFAAGIVNGRLCYAAGHTGGGLISAEAAVLCRTGVSGWEVVSQMPRRRSQVAYVSLDGYLYILGGAEPMPPYYDTPSAVADRMGPF